MPGKTILVCRLKRISMNRRAWSVLEVAAVVVLIAVVAVIALPTITTSLFSSRQNTCYTLKGHIEMEVQLWYRDIGTWPATNLSDIGGDPGYFPEGLPKCPVDGTAYTMDPVTHRIVGHVH